ncbi:MAG: endolytic transglycosylase MltG [Kofleriaceae bacterium]|nr:endolytic transglycosylase MltG [Kofleriaceae bacterium]
MSKRSFRTALAVVVGSLVLIAVLAGWFINRALSYPDEAREGTGKDIEVEIKSGMSFPSIASQLSAQGVIEKPTWFRMYAMWEGKTTQVKPGKYLLKDNETPRAILKKLTEGVKEVTVRVTLPEGKTMLEFFELIEKAQIAKAKDLEALARDKAFLGKFAISADTVEGYLFPDTYLFRINEKPSVVLTRLITRHQEVWNELAAKHPKDTAKLKELTGWSDRDILTMASIVEKEAVVQRERPIIARVFINRLTSKSFKPKKLQTDPTIRYGCMVPLQKSAACIAWHEPCLKANPPKPMGCDRLHRAQLDDQDNPYNSYAHEGLPPGPISNPGRASIEATLSPDDNDYFFFVAKAKGASEHAFAKSVDEHERNVKKYVGTLDD